MKKLRKLKFLYGEIKFCKKTYIIVNRTWENFDMKKLRNLYFSIQTLRKPKVSYRELEKFIYEEIEKAYIFIWRNYENLHFLYK